MKDDDLEEFLLLEDLIFPEEKTDDEDEDGEGEEGEPDGTARRNTRAGTGPRSQPAPSGSGRKRRSGTSLTRSPSMTRCCVPEARILT